MRIFFGILLGISIPLLIYTIFFEHVDLFFMVPIFPILGIFVGMLLAISKKIPPLKIWVLLLIFTLLIGAAAGISKIRYEVMKNLRESKAAAILSLHPKSKILNQKYAVGNGMEKPAYVSMEIETEDSFEKVIRTIDIELQNMGWVIRGNLHPSTRNISWKRKSEEIFLTKKDASGSPTFVLQIDFW